jgi:NADPH-dependent 2,4-dienoyl-CoA reductase/sulfur reductase-like enzyme
MSDRRRLVVIGGVAAGTSAAAKAKRTEPELEVVLLERGANVSYGACGLPYYVAGIIPHAEDLIARTPVEFRQSGIEVRTGHEVLEVKPAKRSVLVTDLNRGAQYELAYDSLVIATGARAVTPDVAGRDLDNVITLRTLSDGVALKRTLTHQRPQSVVIVGGGYIGLEMAEAFRALTLPVTLIEMADRLMTNLDAEMSQLVFEEVVRAGVDVHLNDPLVAFEGSGRLESVTTTSAHIPADLALVSVGVRPNVGLASRAGLTLGTGGAIAVDGHMRTNMDGIYAAGDCTDTRHLVTGQRTYMPLGTTANKQGRVAGANVAGMECTFEGVVGTAVAKVFGLEVARTGLTEKEAQAHGFDVYSQHIKTKDRARYFPGAERLDVKLVMDRSSRRLLGAQLVGGGGAAKRIDVLAAALYARMSVDDLTHLDYSYAPPYASVWDATLRAANVLGRCR